MGLRADLRVPCSPIRRPPTAPPSPRRIPGTSGCARSDRTPPPPVAKAEPWALAFRVRSIRNPTRTAAPRKTKHRGHGRDPAPAGRARRVSAKAQPGRQQPEPQRKECSAHGEGCNRCRPMLATITLATIWTSLSSSLSARHERLRQYRSMNPWFNAGNRSPFTGGTGVAFLDRRSHRGVTGVTDPKQCHRR